MSSYGEEYEAMRQRHRQAIADKRLADRQEHIDALGRQPSLPLKAVLQRTTPARLPDTSLLPAPLPPPVQE